MILRVALDAMGSDRAPEPEVEGALLTVKERENFKIFLVGDEKLLKKKLGRELAGIEIVDAPERISMGDKPSEALRRKRNSSIAVGLRLVKDGIADAFVSAGNTGAILAFSLKTLGRLEGVRRPALGITLPTIEGESILIDVGANAKAKPIDLFQFGVMGSIFMKTGGFSKNPRIALLSIGEEETKGNELIKETKELFVRDGRLNFIGYIEGDKLLRGEAEVIVTDGFTGNVLLKAGEGIMETLMELIKREIKRSLLASLAALLIKPSLKRVKKTFDYEEYGGAPLLGTDGIVVISHGRSTGIAIKNAILLAGKLIENELKKKIEEQLKEFATLEEKT